MGTAKHISTILQNDFNVFFFFFFFFGGCGSWVRGSQFLEGDSRFLELANIDFTLQLLLDLLLTCKLKDVVSRVIFHLCS